MFFLSSCKQQTSTSTGLSKKEQTNDLLIQNQKAMVDDETADIDGYIARRGIKMQSTQTGLRYNIYLKQSATDSIHALDEVEIKFTVSLLNGDLIYSSDSTGTIKLVVGRSELASGLQEGLQMMREHEKAMFIIPSHLAYGLTGDGDKIKQYQSLVVDVEVVDLIGNNRK
ncbi:MAG: FKBP-type peptidyl-prolyl cis-trans isomerase [Bacteroidota bacterium]